jgi:hypothetical protein
MTKQIFYRAIGTVVRIFQREDDQKSKMEYYTKFINDLAEELNISQKEIDLSLNNEAIEIPLITGAKKQRYTRKKKT